MSKTLEQAAQDFAQAVEAKNAAFEALTAAKVAVSEANVAHKEAKIAADVAQFELAKVAAGAQLARSESLYRMDPIAPFTLSLRG